MKNYSFLLLSVLSLSFNSFSQYVTDIKLKKVDKEQPFKTSISTLLPGKVIQRQETKNAIISNVVRGSVNVGTTVTSNGKEGEITIENRSKSSSALIVHSNNAYDEHIFHKEIEGTKISNSCDMDPLSAFVVSIDNKWKVINVKNEKGDVVYGNIREFNITKTISLGDVKSMVCYSTKYLHKFNIVVGVWGDIKTKKLYYVKWDLATNEIKKAEISGAYQGRVVCKDGNIFFSELNKDNKTTHSKLIKLSIKKDSNNGINFELDAFLDLPIPNDLYIQDFIVDKIDGGLAAVYLSENSAGNGVVSVVKISKDYSSCSINSFDKLDLNLWSYEYREGLPSSSNGVIQFNPDSGPVDEHNVLITQRLKPYNSYVVLLRPKKGITTFHAYNHNRNDVIKYEYFTNVPTLISIDHENLKPIGWDAINTHGHITAFGKPGAYLDDFCFRDFYIDYHYNVDKDKYQDRSVTFTEMPKANKSQSSTFKYTQKFVSGTKIDNDIKVLVRYSEDDKYGHKDTKGNVVIPCEYDGSYEFNQTYDIVGVKIGEDYGYIDVNNNVIISIDHEWIGEVVEGMIKAKKEGLYGFYNTKGELIVPFRCVMARDFEFGRTDVRERVKTETNRKLFRNYYIYNDGRKEKQ